MDNKEKEKTGGRQEGLTGLLCILLSVNVLISITVLWLVYSGNGAIRTASAEAVLPVPATVMVSDEVDLPTPATVMASDEVDLPTPEEPSFVQKGRSQERIRSLHSLRQAAAAPSCTETVNASCPDYVLTECGMTLRNLARRYYGSEVFWVCIYDHNNRLLSSPDVLPLGIRLFLPRPADYGIDAADPSSLRRARALAKNLARL